MAADHARAPRRPLVPPLAGLLFVDAAACLALAGALHVRDAALTTVLCTTPGAHVVGALLLGCAWFTLRLAPRFGIGARRLAAWSAGALMVPLGALYGVGEMALATLDAYGGWQAAPGARELAAGAWCAAAAAYAWVTSPMLRR